eukprot:2644730-Prymnesium_polylepis.4
MYPGSVCAEFERAIMYQASPINSGVTSWEECGPAGAKWGRRLDPRPPERKDDGALAGRRTRPPQRSEPNTHASIKLPCQVRPSAQRRAQIRAHSIGRTRATPP